MKNIAIATVVGMALILFLGGSGINALVTALIATTTPVFLYAKLTNYNTKPFIIASVTGLLSSFLSWFLLQLVIVLYGLSDISLNMAYVSVFIGLLLSILTYRQLNKPRKTVSK